MKVFIYGFLMLVSLDVWMRLADTDGPIWIFLIKALCMSTFLVCLDFEINYILDRRKDRVVK